MSALLWLDLLNSQRSCITKYYEYGKEFHEANALNTHKIILEDILKATGKLGRQPHKGHLPC